ncbi:MAG: hypothetical protein WA800_04300 [Terriglobales bacterium]
MKKIDPAIKRITDRVAAHVMDVARERGDKALPFRVLARMNDVPLDGDMGTMLRAINDIWESECLGEWPADFPAPSTMPDTALWN